MCLCGSGGGGIDGGNGGNGDSGESIVHRSGGSVVYRSGGGGLCRSSWYFGVGWGFLGGGGGGCGTGSEGGGQMCCEVSSVVCEWEGVFFWVALAWNWWKWMDCVGVGFSLGW